MTVLDYQAPLRAPRLFWRRGFAFIIDATVANIIVYIVLIGIAVVSGVDLGVPSLASYTQCFPASPQLPAAQQVEKLWLLSPGQTRTNVLCTVTTLGEKKYTYFRSQVTLKEAHSTTNRSVGFLIDAAGNPLPFKPTVDIGLPAFILVFVVFSASGRLSLGKRLFSLQIKRVDDAALQWGVALKREGLKLLPLLLILGFSFWVLLTQAESFSTVAGMIDQVKGELGPNFTVMAAIGIFNLVWWFGPFLFWRGQTWHDMLAGTKVVRK